MSAWTPVLLTAALVSAVCGSPFSWPVTRDTSYRLVPEETPKPISYVIRLAPDLEKSSFTGKVVLKVQAPEKPLNQIKLHSKDIEVSTASVKEDGGDGSDLSSAFTYDIDRDFLILSLKSQLEKDKTYTIEIDYTGKLHDDMYGFYKSSYDVSEGTRYIAATQFQPTHARKAFPCFDEPKYKATFKITIDTPEGYASLCNSPLENTPEPGIRADYIFQETPKMSTYLVAFVVSDFESLNVTDNGISFHTWARSNAIETGKYSIEVTPGILNSLQNYTNILYNYSGLQKVDQVALPDFSAGAMENWGLVTYRETALLYTDGASTANAKQRIATVISHELAHMWFGNLVTTDWWDSTWLNEGFATYFENYITSMVEPDMRIMDQFVVTVHQMIFGADGLAVAQPLTSSCHTPAEVSAMFSSITYSKGGSVLRMLNHSLTEEKFQAALNSYLTDRQFDTAVPSQLMDHLSRVAAGADFIPSNVNFKDVVTSWTVQSGYPVITVNRNYTTNVTTVSQSRFLFSRQENPDNQLWYVPLNWATTSDEFEDTKPKAWLTEETMDIENAISGDGWVIFNIQETGYYRVNYDEDNWKLLQTALREETANIHLLNRAQLVDDALNLARAGYIPYATAFNITGYLAVEEDYIPWLSGLNGLSFLNRRLLGHKDYSYFQTFVLNLLDKVYNKLEFKDDGGHVDKLHRSSILSWACNMGHPGCLANATQKLENFVNSEGKDGVAPDLKSVVYCYGLKNSEGSASWDYLWESYKASNDAFEKTLLLSSLGCTNDQEILTRYLDMSISDSAIRKQDAASVFSAVYSNPAGVETALNFLSSNFDKISSYYGSMGGIGNIVRGIAAQITNDAQKTKFLDFLEQNKEALGTVTLTAEQTVDENLSWSEKYQEEIFEALKTDDNNDSGNSGMISTPEKVTLLTALILCVFYLY
ncbi:aminopeptidase N [Anabrus simplex]|uniref:aminopeptidase N n=1 Tax=Anabrus simplex TaxID=316456 RepID=UPI0035A2AB10